MKGEITCTKRHLKGHRSKLSFSRSGRPVGHISTFPTFHCVPALPPCVVANHQVINCFHPQICRKIGKLWKGTDFFGHQSTLPKKPQTTSSVLSPRAGRRKGGGDFPTWILTQAAEELDEGERVHSRRKWKAPQPAFVSLYMWPGEVAVESSSHFLAVSLLIKWRSKNYKERRVGKQRTSRLSRGKFE